MNLVITPRVSEKAYGQAGTLNTYVFVVPLTANKIEVKKAVEDEYGVEVIDVNIARTSGKVKKSYRKGGRTIAGTRSDLKKAYVRVKDGQTIPVFAAQEQEENNGR
jgi:large subunit ribosomal protein L23